MMLCKQLVVFWRKTQRVETFFFHSVRLNKLVFIQSCSCLMSDHQLSFSLTRTVKFLGAESMAAVGVRFRGMCSSTNSVGSIGRDRANTK